MNDIGFDRKSERRLRALETRTDSTERGTADYDVKGFGGATGLGIASDYAAVLTTAQAARDNGGGRVIFGAKGARLFRLDLGLPLYDNVEYHIPDGAALDFTNAPTSAKLFSGGGTEGTPVLLTADAALGATTLTIASGAAATAGIVKDSLLRLGSGAIFDPDRTGTQIGESVFVLSVTPGTPDTITLRSPTVGGPYTTADLATVAKLTPQVRPRVTGGGRIIGGGAGKAHEGIEIDRAIHARVKQVAIEGCEATGVVINDCVDGLVDGISVEGANLSPVGYGVTVGVCSQDVRVVDSYFRDCRHATTMGSKPPGGGDVRKGLARRVKFEGNQISDSASSGDAMDTHAACEDIEIIGNTIYDSTSHGINMECAKGTIADNVIVRTAAHGINYANQTSQPTEVTISGNKIRYAGNRGISVTDGGVTTSIATEAINVENNRVTRPVGIGIYVRGISTRLHTAAINGNTIRAAGATPAMLLQQVDDSSVVGNTITDVLATGRGIQLIDGIANTINSNTIKFLSLSTGTGIFLNPGTSCTIVGNTVDSAGTGVNADASSGDCTIGPNTFKSCTAPYNLSALAGHDHIVAEGSPAQFPNVASAATVTIAQHLRQARITGTVTITSITASRPGREITLHFSAIGLTLTNGSNLKLNGNLVTTAVDRHSITLKMDATGTNWVEQTRSMN